MRPSWTRALLALSCFILVEDVALTHPITLGHHDRSVQIRLTQEGVQVEYTLALDGWTLAQDLAPFRKELGPVDDAAALYAGFARIHGPAIAKGLAATVDGQELVFECCAHELVIEDHFRFLFRLKAAWPPRLDAGPHTLVLTDSNFALEPGEFKLAALGDGKMLRSANVPKTLELAIPVMMLEADPQREEVQRTARLTFALAEAQPKVETTPPLPRPDPSFWNLAASLDVNRLLASGYGLALLLCLAFFFGAAHALQPGHGKTLVAAYLVGEKGSVVHAFFLGLVTTFTHTFMVIFLALLLPWVFPEAGPGALFALSLGSGLIVVLLAFWLLLRRLGGQADHVHLFGGHHHHDERTDGRVTWWALVTLGITGGLVPCVDALGLLATTVVLSKLWLGLPLILAFSAGLASVLVAVGVLVVKFKRLASTRFGEGRFVKSLPIISALATLLLGLWMCQQALQQRELLEERTDAPYKIGRTSSQDTEVNHAGR